MDVGLRENGKGRGEIAFEINGPAALINRFIVALRRAKNLPLACSDKWRKRIEFLGGLNLLERLFRTANLRQMSRVPMMGIGTV